jgi:hypothetical protein
MDGGQQSAVFSFIGKPEAILSKALDNIAFCFPRRQKATVSIEIRRLAKPHAPLGSLPSVALSCANKNNISIHHGLLDYSICTEHETLPLRRMLARIMILYYQPSIIAALEKKHHSHIGI